MVRARVNLEGLGQIDEALSSYDKALELRPGYVEAATARNKLDSN